MALSVVNNTAALNAQQNLGRANGLLSKSLERLSTGLKINRGADGPAGLVISEQQRAQIAGLKTALDNSNKAVSLVQTAEGALNEINGLLTKARGLALDSANSAVNDSNALAANQAEISNILSSIDNIAATTKFGTKALLNGAAKAGTVSSTTTGVSVSGTLTGTPVNTSYSFTVGTAGKAATVTGTGGFTGTGGTLDTGNAGTVIINSVAVALADTDTAATAAVKINTALTAAGKNVRATDVSGQLKLTATDFTTSVVVAAGSAALADAGLTAATTAGTAGSLSYVDSTGSTITTASTTASPNVFTITSGDLNGAVVTLSADPTNAAQTIAPAAATFTVGANLVFQVGANQNETSSIGIARVASDSLGLGAVAGVNSLKDINLTTSTGSQNALAVIDSAINQVSTIRGTLGAFQANSLESNARSLQATLENTTAAESVIRDTDFASEIAEFTRLQTQVQAGATVLGNANQTTQLVAQLLRG